MNAGILPLSGFEIMVSDLRALFSKQIFCRVNSLRSDL